jgi:hypothetical protein
MKICGKCGKEILKGQDYLKVILYENEKPTEEKFAHKSCWELEINQRELLSKSLNMLNAAEGFMAESGMFPKVVKI